MASYASTAALANYFQLPFTDVESALNHVNSLAQNSLPDLGDRLAANCKAMRAVTKKISDAKARVAVLKASGIDDVDFQRKCRGLVEHHDDLRSHWERLFDLVAQQVLSQKHRGQHATGAKPKSLEHSEGAERGREKTRQHNAMERSLRPGDWEDRPHRKRRHRVGKIGYASTSSGGPQC